MSKQEDTEAFLAQIREDSDKGEKVLRRVKRRGACWYQQTMASGQKLGEPVLVVTTGPMNRVALDGVCFHRDGVSYELHVFPDGVLDRLVTPTEVEKHIRLAVAYEERRLRTLAKRLLPRVLPKNRQKMGAA